VIDPTPRFSIVIPTYDRPQPLKACLEALTGLDYPRDRFEVILADDGSPSPAEGVVTSFRDRLDLTLVLLPHAGPATARNAGAARARGDYLAFTDDDCTPHPGWLRALAARFAAEPDGMVGGRTINRLAENPYAAATQALVDYLHLTLHAEAGRFFASNNMATPAEAFRETGGFDARFPLAAAEDREFCNRWRRQGRPMYFDRDAVVHHANSLDFRRFCRQHYNYGRGAYFFRELVARKGHVVKLEPLTFYGNLVRHAFSSQRSLRGAGLSLLLGVSQLANAAGYFSEKLRQIDRCKKSSPLNSAVP
jgi:glycosyltransferase involved in cell wall biosynthesis